MTVRSKLGQPLNVEIQIESLKPGEEKSLSARLASPQAHKKAGIAFSRTLTDLRVSIDRRAGRPIVRLRTARPVNEAFLETLVQLRSNGGAAVRRYTVLLDPRGYAGAVASPPTAKPPAGPNPASPQSDTRKAEPPSPAPGAREPLSREELFGLPPRNGAPPAQIQPSSRDELFGVSKGDVAAATPARGPAPVEWRGFVQNTTAYDYQEPKHWSRAVVRTQLGAQGGSGDLKWKASARLDVDPVYFNSGFYPEAVRKDQRLDLLLRETYVDTSLAGLQLRLGKQHIVWGEMVGLFFADVVSARDQRDFVLPDFDIIRIPQWAARVERFGENSHAELVWLPYPEVDNIGKPGAEFYPLRGPAPSGFTQEFNDVAKPERNLRNSNFGARGSTLQNGWDLSAFYYRSTDVNPTFYREVVLAPTPTIVFSPRHDRIWQLGGTLGKDLRSFVAKAEVIYTAGRKYNVTRLTEPDGVVAQKTVDYVVGLDFTLPRETRFNVQYFDRVFFDHDPDLVQDRRESGVTLLVSGKLGDALYPEVLLIQSLNRNDRLGRAKLGWTPQKNWRLTLGVDVFVGPPTGLFGRFDDRDRVYAEARYDF